MAPNPDRTVHAVLADGGEVVRYERAGKWCLENPSGLRGALTLKESVDCAVRAGSTVHLGRAGGTMFDSRVRGRRKN